MKTRTLNIYVCYAANTLVLPVACYSWRVTRAMLVGFSYILNKFSYVYLLGALLVFCFLFTLRQTCMGGCRTFLDAIQITDIRILARKRYHSLRVRQCLTRVL